MRRSFICFVFDDKPLQYRWYIQLFTKGYPGATARTGSLRQNVLRRTTGM